MGPTFAISPAMLRSSNNARLMVGACRRRTASSARKWSSSRGARRRDYRRIPAVNSFSKFLLLTPKGRSEAEIGVDAAFQVREHSYLWSSVDPTLPYPLPCYGLLTCWTCCLRRRLSCGRWRSPRGRSSCVCCLCCLCCPCCPCSCCAACGAACAALGVAPAACAAPAARAPHVLRLALSILSILFSGTTRRWIAGSSGAAGRAPSSTSPPKR